MALKIQMFSDFICPFCYIGFEVMKGLQPEFGFELEWRGYQIHPEWPAEGIPADRVREGSSAERGGPTTRLGASSLDREALAAPGAGFAASGAASRSVARP
jgi:predicted DsbA family dithiol-disulfide isomerase